MTHSKTKPLVSLNDTRSAHLSPLPIGFNQVTVSANSKYTRLVYNSAADDIQGKYPCILIVVRSVFSNLSNIFDVESAKLFMKLLYILSFITFWILCHNARFLMSSRRQTIFASNERRHALRDGSFRFTFLPEEKTRQSLKSKWREIQWIELHSAFSPKRKEERTQVS